MKLKKFLPLLPALLLAGCTSTFTRLTPLEQPRNANNQYPVEVRFETTRQSLRWESIKPYVQVNGELYQLRPEEGMANRWEGFVPVPPGVSSVNYRFKFDYLYNAINKPPQPNSAWSPVYKLRISDQ